MNEKESALGTRLGAAARPPWLLCGAALASLCLGWACAAAPQVTQESAPMAQQQGEEMPRWPQLNYPASPRGEAFDLLWGQEVPDPFRWLEEVDQPATQAWMTAQDALAVSVLHPLPLRESLAQRLTELFYVDAISPPRQRGERLFYSRRHADREKTIYYVREADGRERVLLDPNTLSEDGSVAVGVFVPSWDGQRVAYALRANNADEATLYVMRVDDGSTSELDVIEGAKYARPVWTPENDAFYYTWLPVDPTIPVDERPGWAEIRRHTIGSDPATDAIVRERLGDPRKFSSVALSRNGRWLLHYVHFGWNETEVFVRDLHDPGADFVALPVQAQRLYEVLPHEDAFYVFTNEGAPRYRLFKVDPSDLAREGWVEVVAEDPEAVIEEAAILGGRLVLRTLVDTFGHIVTLDLEGGDRREVALPGMGAVTALVGRAEDSVAYFAFESPTLPPQVHTLDLRTHATALWSAVTVPIDPSPYVVEQHWFTSKDGTRVPLQMIRRRDLERHGQNPVLLYGYGGFNVSIVPAFRASTYAWLEAGGTYVAVNLRGGGEFGEAWHQAGMREKKQNVFDDFIAAAEYLIAEGYTSPAHLGIYGGSNGGLLVGAAVVQRPELFGAVVCAVPLLDMVRYHRFGSGRTWIAEYGSVEESEDLFAAIYAYSPYHHVAPGQGYPPTLFLSADSDDRVDPMHARKMAAAMQVAGADTVLLRIERNAGHGGTDLVKQAVAKNAEVFAFLWQALAP